MSSFDNRKRLAGPESHRYICIAEPLIKAFLKNNRKHDDLLNDLGVNFRSSQRFNRKTLDERLVDAEQKLDNDPGLAVSMNLYHLYHESVVENLHKLKGRPVIFTPAFSYDESINDEFSSIIGDDYFSSNFRLSRVYLESANEIYDKKGIVPRVVLFPVASPIVFPASFEADNGGLKLVHALKTCCEKANTDTRYKQKFITLEKKDDSVRFCKNYSINPSYYMHNKKFENRSDPYFNFKEEHRKIHRTIASYCLAYVISELNLDRVVSHIPSSGAETEIIKCAARLSGKVYVPSNPLKNANMPKLGLCCKESQNIFKRLLINSYGKVEDCQGRLF